MDLEPDARLVVNRGVDPRKLPLTPVDFFVYSRVEALDGSNPPSVADIVAASGQSVAEATASLHKLLELGAIALGPALEAARDRPSEGPHGSPREVARDNHANDLRERARH